jgi:hypothetical protein
VAALRRAEQAETTGAGRVRHSDGRRHLRVEGQIDPVPVGQPAAGLVVADHGEPVGQAGHEGTEGEELQLRAEVGHPA